MKCDELIEKIKQAYDDYRHKFIPINYLRRKLGF